MFWFVLTVSASALGNIYMHTWGLSILVKELTAATRVMKSSSNELSTLVSGKVKYKQTKATT